MEASSTESIFVIEEKQLHSFFSIKLFIKSSYFLFDSCPKIIANLDRLITQIYNICHMRKKKGNSKIIKEAVVNLEVITLCLALDNVHIENCFVFNVEFDKIEYFF